MDVSTSPALSKAAFAFGGSPDMSDRPVVRVVIPGPPKAWKRAGHRTIQPKDGRKAFTTTFTDTDTRSEQAVLRSLAYDAMEGRPILQGAIDFRASFHMPVPASWSQKKRTAALAGKILPTVKPDFDNLSKMIDALKGVLWRDDALITDAHIYKRYSDRPRTIMEVREK